MRFRSVDDVLRNNLFGPVERGNGLDLVAANAQRGRDHGLQPYLEYRRHYRLYVPNSFLQLKSLLYLYSFYIYSAKLW